MGAQHTILGEPVPRAVQEAAKAAFETRGDSHLARLTFDSFPEGADPGRVHALRFEYADLSLDLRILVTRHGAVISGHLRPPQRAKVELGYATTGLRLVVETSDKDGSLEFSLIGHGLVRLIMECQGRKPAVVRTEWFRV